MATTKQAPGDLELVRAFVNTNDIDAGEDALADPAGLRDWLGEHGLLAGAAGQAAAGAEAAGVDEAAPLPSERERQMAVELREALRVLMLGNNDGRPPEPAAVEALRTIARQSPLEVTVGEHGALLVDVATGGVRGALARLLLAVERAMADGTWYRLKACRDDTCQWGFYDHSKNHSRTWCSMDSCGSRNKAREYRRRHAAHEHG